MNLVDSSGWLEYFADGPNASFFAESIEHPDELIVPTISIYEVFKVVLRQRTESEALRAIAFMQEGRVTDLTTSIALHAAHLSSVTGLPMADSIILATARDRDALVWTQDADFEGLDGVRFTARV